LEFYCLVLRAAVEEDDDWPARTAVGAAHNRVGLRSRAVFWWKWNRFCRRSRSHAGQDFGKECSGSACHDSALVRALAVRDCGGRDVPYAASGKT